MMDYVDVNAKHHSVIRQICVDAKGKCLVALKKGGGFSADSPAEADKILKELERKSADGRKD